LWKPAIETNLPLDIENDALGRPRYVTNYNVAVRWLRQNGSTDDLEYTKHGAQHVGDVPADQWQVFAEVVRCTPTPTTQLMQLMSPDNFS
jgi:hypothetical protein